MLDTDAHIAVWRNDDGDFECQWGVIKHRQMHDAGTGKSHLIVVRKDAVARLVGGPAFDGRAWASVTVRRPEPPCECVCIGCIADTHCDTASCAQTTDHAESLDWNDVWNIHADENRPQVFFHLDYGENKRLTWELFEARWSDIDGPEIYVGRWPD